MSSASASSVERFGTLLDNLLERAKVLRPAGTVEPVLRYEDLKDGIDAVGTLTKELGSVSNAAIDAAVRKIFYGLISSLSIDDEGFGAVWSLLDIANSVSDFEYTEAGLALRLVEELFEAQTLDGCRVVLDYLDCRHQFLTEKFFENRKSLIILRSCNDLLRRSSRAEDNAFCGRVFIFLFQSVPLGEKSAVNLRGQFHTENVTLYDLLLLNQQTACDPMLVDSTNDSTNEATNDEAKHDANGTSSREAGALHTTDAGKTVTFEATAKEDMTDSQNMDDLYMTFWSLQEYFSKPMTLLTSEAISIFQQKLKKVMAKFQAIQDTQLANGANKVSIEAVKGAKRKREDRASEFTSIFNPKYLTSRDLFDLEIIDLSFRRHFLVQALILIEFLLSLTVKAKAKFFPPEIDQNNNSATKYSYTLSDEDAKWATQTKTEIANYLQAGPEGKFYYRMVDTVLSRDKNWAYWKARSCPEIKLKPLTPEEVMDAEKGAQKACAPRRIRPTVLGALDLSFLNTKHSVDGFAKYKDPERFQIPAVDALKGSIAEDEFDIELAKDDAGRRAAQERKASKLWRTLRIASRGRLSAFDQIDDGNDLKPLFEPNPVSEMPKSEVNGNKGPDDPTEKNESQASAESKSGIDTPNASASIEATSN